MAKVVGREEAGSVSGALTRSQNVELPELDLPKFVDDAMKLQEVVMGLYVCPDTSASSLFILLDDAMLRLFHGTDGLRCHCLDGASNMSGRVSGV